MKKSDVLRGALVVSKVSNAKPEVRGFFPLIGCPIRHFSLLPSLYCLRNVELFRL
jgi:hypothetical protein